MIDDDTYQGKYLETSNQPARFFGTAKTHKFNQIEDINIRDLKLRAIIDQTGTYTYYATKVIANYFKPLAKNDFIITNMLPFPDMLNKANNSEDSEDAFYDGESLFTNISVKETIQYILHKVYADKSIKPFCKKSIFKKLLVKLTQECVFSVNSRLIKRIDGCPLGGSVSIVFSVFIVLSIVHFILHIYMCKMKQNVQFPLNPFFVNVRLMTHIYAKTKIFMTNYSRISIATLRTLN